MSQDQVRTTLGTPTTTATVGAGSAYYYISSTTGQTSFFKPVEKDRKVLAVYFSPLGSVDRVAQYGLKDGKVFDYVKQRDAHAGAGTRASSRPCSAISAPSSLVSSDRVGTALRRSWIMLEVEQHVRVERGLAICLP